MSRHLPPEPMSDHKPTDPAKLRRQERLEATLRDNLRRRKAQAKARSVGEPAEPAPDGDEAAE